MAKQGNGTTIIKKIKKGGGHGHHGGAWKVAYADFVTAMMAFFLLLWLLNVTTDVQKRGIADYFEPTLSMKSETSGSGGILGGQSIGKPGALTQNMSAPSITVPIPSERRLEDGDEGEEAGDSHKAKNPGDPLRGEQLNDPEKTDAGYGTADVKSDKVNQANAAKVALEKENRQFAAAEFSLRQALQDIPELKDLRDNLMIDRTPEGLRIQLVDQEKSSMFALGSNEMNEQAKKLMTLVAQAIQKLPNKISITGHTDSTPFARAGNYGNWELSSDRANASRRALLAAGLPADRVQTVVGTADRDPLVADQPASPRNRRISIMLLRETPPPTAGKLAQR
jgi:chemotaxis protein MotB